MIHVCYTPMEEIHREADGERWCFVCRRRRRFDYIVQAPIDKMSYYGPNPAIVCEMGHGDGDLFPGRVREWDYE